MPSTFSDLKIELIATGEESGTWGNTTNTNLGTALEEAIVGRATANFTTDADLTLTLTDTNATQVARNFILNVTSGVSLTTTRNLIVPTIDKPYIVENNTTGSQSIIVKTSAGTGVTVPNGKTMMVYANSTNVVPAFNNLASGTTLAGNTIGDVIGPASSTDNAFVRFDSTTGKLIQNSTGATLDDTGIPTFTGSINISGTAASAADIKLYEDTDNGTNYVGLKAPAAITADTTWTLPNADGTNGQALVTNGTGTLSWTTITSGATISNDTSTASNLYPAFLGATSGTALNIYTSNAKLLYKPSTGDFQASQLVAGNGLILNSTTVAASYTVAAGTNAMSVGPITVASGQSVTVSSGQKWVVI